MTTRNDASGLVSKITLIAVAGYVAGWAMGFGTAWYVLTKLAEAT